MTKRSYDSTVARIAGNIASAWPTSINSDSDTLNAFARKAVELARAIIAEVERTEPRPAEDVF